MPVTVNQISAKDLKGRFDQGETSVLLDVREDDERAYAAISAPAEVVDLHIPLGELTARVDEVRDVASRGSLIVYCHHGQRSMVAATWLARQGLSDVQNLDGGIDAWSKLVDPGVRRY